MEKQPTVGMFATIIDHRAPFSDGLESVSTKAISESISKVESKEKEEKDQDSQQVKHEESPSTASNNETKSEQQESCTIS